MATLPPLRNASDAYVNEKTPSTNYDTSQRIYLTEESASNTRYGYIYFGLPSGITGTQIMSAKLRLYSGTGFGGSVTLSIQRVSAKFSVNRLTWNNKPGVTGPVKSITKTSAPNGTPWEFDVRDVMQQVADGLPWYGFRISATNSNTKWLYSSSNSSSFHRPALYITWSDAPNAPDNLIPDGTAVSVAKPTLRWSFVDRSGDQTMQSYYLRLFSTEALAIANGTGDLLDLDTPSTIPQSDLDTTTYSGLAEGGQVWWRVRNTDGAGLVSAWSDVATFTRTAKGSLAITNPPAGAGSYVEEPTPPITWTFTGATQLAYEVILATPEAPERYLWRVVGSGTDTSVTPPTGKIVTPGATYRVTVRVWDTEDRVDLPDDPAYVEASQDFTFQLSTGVSPLAGLTGQPDPYRPRMTLSWQRDTAPDSYVILRDGVVVAQPEPQDVLVSGTDYTYHDDEATPRVSHTWEVAVKVNGVTSTNNPSVTGIVRALTTTLSETDGDRVIYLFNPDVSAEKAETSDVHYPLGDAPPVMITQSLRGYEGTVTGMLASNVVPGVTAASQLENLEFFRDHPGLVLKLIWVDKVMRVVVRAVTHEPVPYADGTAEYLASFDFIQVD